jgi:hypothetical protein
MHQSEMTLAKQLCAVLSQSKYFPLRESSHTN